MADDVREGRNVYMADVHQSSLASDDDSGCALEEYVWVPPGLNPEQVCKGLVSTSSTIIIRICSNTLHCWFARIKCKHTDTDSVFQVHA